jgi:hypothetical protein
MILAIVVAAAAVVAQYYLYPTAFGRRYIVPLFYRTGRPTKAGRQLNRAWSLLVSLGWTPSVWPGNPRIGPASLETTGRNSGRVCRNMVTWVEYEGERYFVSMLGETSDWVENVRASGGRAAIRRGRRIDVHLLEVPSVERAPIIQAWYQRTWSSTSPHLKIDPGAPLEAFEQIALAHPVFRIVGEGG